MNGGVGEWVGRRGERVERERVEREREIESFHRNESQRGSEFVGKGVNLLTHSSIRHQVGMVRQV